MFNTPTNSFFTQALTGEHTWINPPFHLIEQAVSHYLSEKGKAPLTTSACILAPDWPGSTWEPLVQGMKVLCTYPKGYPLYELINIDGTTDVVKGIPWPVKIYYDPPYPACTIKKAHSKGDPSLTMQFRCTVAGDSALAIADTGATHCFMDKAKAAQRGLHCSRHHRVVELADGSQTTSTYKCSALLRIRGTEGRLYTKHITFFVLELGEAHDIILGQDWMTLEGAELSYKKGSITINPNSGGGEITLMHEDPSPKPPTSNNPFSH